MSRSGLELAPMVTVRVAAWPLQAIACFGRMPIEPRAADPEAYDRAYRAALEEDRALLWKQTVGDPRFMRALALANPELARSVLGLERPSQRNKATRHLETTLYRYLARASTRPQPGDMWATVALAGFGTRRVIERRAGRCAIAPDLAPFRSFVNALALRSPYLERGPYKLNPTLTRKDDGSYVFCSPPASTPSVQRRVSAGRQVDEIIATLAGAGSWTRTAAADAVARWLKITVAAARRTIDQLCDKGVLVGGLTFPRRFSEPWQPLESIERELEPEHSEVWRQARLRLAALARELADNIHAMDPASVIAVMASGRAELAALARGLEIEGFVPPRAPFRCDFEAPWEIQLGPADASALEKTIESFLRYEHHEGLHGPLVDAVAARMVPKSGPLGTVEQARCHAAADGVVAWDAVLSDYSDAVELRRRCDRLERQIDAPGDDVCVDSGFSGRSTSEASRPMIAALYCSRLPDALGGGAFVHGLALDPTSAYARFATLLESEAERSLARWFVDAFRRLGEHIGAQPVAILYDHTTPNVIAHPELWPAVIDLWGASVTDVVSRDVRLAFDTDQRRVLVWVDGRPRIVFAPTAANPTFDDPCHQALLLSSMHVPALTSQGTKLVHATEISSTRHRPRLRLESADVIQCRRTVVMFDELEPLLRARGAARFALWQELATRYEWPELVSLHVRGTWPLVVRRDSPLAIEAAFEGAGSLRSLLVEEFICSAWVRDENAGADDVYVADLVAPFACALNATMSNRVEVPVARARGVEGVP